MSWENILKVRTNEETPERLHGQDTFLVNDDIYRQAGGRVLGETEGDRFMDIEDIEEAIGRKLTIRDFKNHHLNWKSNTNKTLLDRVGGFRGQQQLAENQISELLDDLHRGKPVDSPRMYFNIFKAFMEIFGDTSRLIEEVRFALRTYMDIHSIRD